MIKSHQITSATLEQKRLAEVCALMYERLAADGAASLSSGSISANQSSITATVLGTPLTVVLHPIVVDASFVSIELAFFVDRLDTSQCVLCLYLDRHGVIGMTPDAGSGLCDIHDNAFGAKIISVLAAALLESNVFTPTSVGTEISKPWHQTLNNRRLPPKLETT